MTGHLHLIARKLDHLRRMRRYLEHSFKRCSDIFPATNWQAVSMEQHEMLAAYRVRFSEFQEHLGKTMRAIAIEEEVDVERFGSVLAFMEKLCVLESADRWKMIREIRNAVNHEYEEDAERFSLFFTEMFKATPELFACHDKLVSFCAEAYGLGSSSI
ncbi:MAG: hypothetical protein HGA97_11965 [Chlorobiaceae bacterium]|jgi:hypothetical protein|nr:hypothetical protein [Chlorobiaceae bacterium]